MTMRKWAKSNCFPYTLHKRGMNGGIGPWAKCSRLFSFSSFLAPFDLSLPSVFSSGFPVSFWIGQGATLPSRLDTPSRMVVWIYACYIPLFLLSAIATNHSSLRVSDIQFLLSYTSTCILKSNTIVGKAITNEQTKTVLLRLIKIWENWKNTVNTFWEKFYWRIFKNFLEKTQ